MREGGGKHPGCKRRFSRTFQNRQSHTKSSLDQTRDVFIRDTPQQLDAANACIDCFWSGKRSTPSLPSFPSAASTAVMNGIGGRRGHRPSIGGKAPCLPTIYHPLRPASRLRPVSRDCDWQYQLCGLLVFTYDWHSGRSKEIGSIDLAANLPAITFIQPLRLQ